jgi:CelD/BcsL family acetyltransferase involved in cellulose biosynthesis
MMTVEKISTREGLQQIEPVWNELLNESVANSITLTWEWMTTWWEVFSEGRELFVLVVRDREQVIAIAPLLKRTVQHYGVLSYQRLEFLASGEEEADEICSEYLDFIIKRGREREAIEAVMGYLRECEREWDEVMMTDVSVESESLPHLEKICEASGARLQVARNEMCVYLPLAQDWETFLGMVSREFRTKIRKNRRIAEASGAEVKVIDSEEGFKEGFEMLVRLHQARWQEKGEPGVFSSEKFTRFHKLLAPRLLRKGWAKLLILSVSGEAVAALYNFTYGNKVYFYQAGFSQSDGRIPSPGALLHSYAIEQAISEGCVEYDFLKGEGDSYKVAWGGQRRGIIQVRLAQRQSKEALYSATTKFMAGLRQVNRTVKSHDVTRKLLTILGA